MAFESDIEADTRPADAPAPGATRRARRADVLERAELARLRADVRSLRRTVENDHDHRLRRIETDLRWVIVLLGGQVVALLGAAASGLMGG